MNLWIKRALGAAVLGEGLLAASAGAAGAQEVSADVSARLGRPTAADVRVCADGRLLSRLVGSCSQAGSGTTGSVQADRASGVRVRARVPRLASADVADQAPAGIGVLDTGPIASGDQATVDVGDVSPSVPVSVCGNGAGLLGDASVVCAADTSTGGTTAPRRGPPTRAARPTPTASRARPGRPAPPASLGPPPG